jgi:hypothetical protein
MLSCLVMHRRYFPRLGANGPAYPCRCKGRVRACVIYRCGTTNARALTGEKGDSRLPTPLAQDRWKFWMQISRHETEGHLHGFALETAVAQVAGKGYYMFVGSIRLLETRTVARSATPKCQSMFHVPSAGSH